LARLPNQLIETPPPADDVLSAVLRAVRLSGSVQFCFMPCGDWQTDATPSLARLARPGGATPFHIVAQGSCWLKLEGRTVELAQGDVVAFPFGTGHQLGAGDGGLQVAPVDDLPPRPWREVPVLRYGAGGQGVRLLCGYLEFAAASFQPLREALPTLLHVRTRGDNFGWLRATIERIVAEVDHPRAGGVSVLERLTEITFIEVLRHHFEAARPGARGWLAAMTDPALARCLAAVHADPGRDWTLEAFASVGGLSRSAMTERFETVLGTSPMRYLRDWRLCLAGVALSTTGQSIAAIAHDAGYGSEAAFNRAFAKSQGAPPAAWRKAAQQSASG
jgi:AraC-like DNA-binding protein